MGFFQQVSGPFALEKLGGPTAERLDAAEDLDQVRPGRVSQPVGDRGGVRAPGQDRRPVADRSIEIATFQTAVEIIGQDPEKWRPRTRETADHSLPYCTAVALVDGEVSAEQFTPERLADPALARPRGRTTVVEDPALTAGYPAGIPNRVTVTLDDGTTLVLRGRLPSRPRQEPAHRRAACDEVPRAGRPGPRAEEARRGDLGAASWSWKSDPTPHETIALA